MLFRRSIDYRRRFFLSAIGVGSLIVALSAVMEQAALAQETTPPPKSESTSAPRETKPADSAPCTTSGAFRDVWTKVGERTCLKCHHADGDAADSRFVLVDLTRVPSDERPAAAARNCATFTRWAMVNEEGGRSRLLAKAVGELDHGGEVALEMDSTEFRLLEEFVRIVRRPAAVASNSSDPAMSADPDEFFAGVHMISDQRLLRRVTLSLGARLPIASERAAIDAGGLDALKPILNDLMREPAFYERLKEGFNDILLTFGYDGNGEDVLSYNHFEHTRHWYQNHNLDHIPEADRQRARYKLADQYREAMRREPLELIQYIVEHDRPFTEVLTADYTMMSPYTARGYGQFEELREQFRNPEDPFEFIPAKVKALKHRDGALQETPDGLYPHAGLLTMFQYLRRYPTTETNRNRLRARMYYQHFLGVDVMNLAPRVSDAAAIDAKYEIPTMQAAECVVCHTTIDPIAGLFQDYYNEEGHFGPRKDGWFKDMFGPGCEGTDLPDVERWRALQWLGERTVRDPRFAIAVTEHVYYILMGRKTLASPQDIDDPLYESRRRAYLVQRGVIEQAAERFRRENFNLKSLFQELAASPLYRADGLDAAADRPERLAELEDIGVVRMLSPEQLERKIEAVFGKPWGRLSESYAILYGGIDSKEVTERLTDPSGAIGSLQRIMANDVACRFVAADFALPAAERKLFPGIEPDAVPKDGDVESEQRIRAAIVHLHQYILGRTDAPDDPDVDESYRLFAGIVKEATSREQFERIESYFCKSSGQEGPRDPDPHYTLRAWRAVVTYLLRQDDFLYE